MSMEDVTRTYEGSAKVGRIMKSFATITLKPEDFSSPVSFQMAISRIYESMLRMMESGGPQHTYMAEVRFTDDLGNTVVFAVDLGPNLPPFSSEKVKARIVVQLYEED
ncbi:MAG: hypothetical protein N3F67_01055 [Acidilobaceae archaeon]|nr:hypothetical protein [Acidilobaceae archaeon]